MTQSGAKQPVSRISGQIIINELTRNMELGRLELGYSVLLPCIFSVYLHPDDHSRLSSVQEIIREDARRALNARVAEWNKSSSLFRRGAVRKPFRIAQNDWWIGFFADAEGSVPPGDVEIHSELADAAPPGYRGMKTTLLEREPSVTAARVARDRETTRRRPDEVLAEIRYSDDSGPQTYLIVQDEISIGRGGDDLWADLPLYAGDEVSREHAHVRRDPGTGAFTIVDMSRNGTWLNGKRLARGVAERLPDRAEIGIAGVLKLSFETRK